MSWTVFFTSESEQMLLGIQDRRIRKLIMSKAMGLKTNPDLQGKPLGGDMAGLRSIRAVGQRYRIIYELFPANHEVWVVAVGIRRAGNRDDIYELAKRLK
jgi:mRNA interferase RelE/StbE